MTPVHVTFDPHPTPARLALTVAEWRRVSREAYGGVPWEMAAMEHAFRYGGALVLRADDSLVVFTRHRQSSGGMTWVNQKTHKPGTWSWATPEEAEELAR